MSLVFRPLQTSDFEPACELWHATPGVRVTESREMFERFLARNPELGCVALEGNQLVGAVMCGHDGRRGYLYHLAVAMTHRRQGIARRLVETCLIQLRNLKIEKCSAFLFTSNEEGLRFWQRSGWRERVDLRIMAQEIA